MKLKIASLFLFFLIGGIVKIDAQNTPCKVLKKGIQQEYIGKCKNGLANGKGIAKGKYIYEGKFKKGLPEGKGKLTFSEGNYYDGQWKNGLMDGRGAHYFKVNGVDSVRVGYWEKGKYIGKILIPDYVVKWNRGVDRYNFNLLNENITSATNKIFIKFKQNGGDNVTISNLSIVGDSGNRIGTSNQEGYENVTFPFTCKLNYDTANKLKTSTNSIIFTFVINKPGEWEVILNN